MIAASVSVSVFLTVLVIAVAFIVWYRMKVKGEITRSQESVDQPTASDNLTAGLEPDTLRATNLQREDSASSEDNGPVPRATEV